MICCSGEIGTYERQSKINLIDLAGSERAQTAGTKGKQLTEVLSTALLHIISTELHQQQVQNCKDRTQVHEQ
jgi:hypothetical protein